MLHRNNWYTQLLLTRTWCRRQNICASSQQYTIALHHLQWASEVSRLRRHGAWPDCKQAKDSSSLCKVQRAAEGQACPANVAISYLLAEHLFVDQASSWEAPC